MESTQTKKLVSPVHSVDVLAFFATLSMQENTIHLSMSKTVHADDSGKSQVAWRAQDNDEDVDIFTLKAPGGFEMGGSAPFDKPLTEHGEGHCITDQLSHVVQNPEVL